MMEVVGRGRPEPVQAVQVQGGLAHAGPIVQQVADQRGTFQFLVEPGGHQQPDNLQVIVYAGAIMVLVLFVVMLLNLPADARRPRSGMIQGGLGFVLSILFAGAVGWAMARGMQGRTFAPPTHGFGTVESLGRELFSAYFYAFEALSLLLVVAMIGAVLLAKRRL